MTIKIKTEEGREVPTLSTSNMTDKEYIIVEKLYDEPKTGSGTNEKGSFDWRLYGVKLIEYKTMDDVTESMKVFKPNINVSYFNNGKSFVPAFDKVPVGAVVKVTQFKADGKSYRSFKVEVVSGGAPAVVETKKESVDINTKAAQLKSVGVPREVAASMLAKEFNVTEDFASARYEAQ